MTGDVVAEEAEGVGGGLVASRQVDAQAGEAVKEEEFEGDDKEEPAVAFPDGEAEEGMTFELLEVHGGPLWRRCPCRKHPLQCINLRSGASRRFGASLCRCSSTAEHRFRKAGVVGSNPTIGSEANAAGVRPCGVIRFSARYR